MIFKIVAIRDIVADVYQPPQFTPNLGSAIRSFGDACKDKNHPLGQHPEDYELYHLGDYDDAHGTFDVEHSDSGFDRKQIAVGSSYKDK